MAWYRDAYAPDLSSRSEITVSPLRASLGDLKDLPPAFVIVDENDVLRDEREAYARRLTEAGVPTTTIRYNGILHECPYENARKPRERDDPTRLIVLSP
jgi:acetyl esterase